jgi:hypothetical protein
MAAEQAIQKHIHASRKISFFHNERQMLIGLPYVAKTELKGLFCMQFLLCTLLCPMVKNNI